MHSHQGRKCINGEVCPESTNLAHSGGALHNSLKSTVGLCTALSQTEQSWTASVRMTMTMDFKINLSALGRN